MHNRGVWTTAMRQQRRRDLLTANFEQPSVQAASRESPSVGHIRAVAGPPANRSKHDNGEPMSSQDELLAIPGQLTMQYGVCSILADATGTALSR